MFVITRRSGIQEVGLYREKKVDLFKEGFSSESSRMCCPATVLTRVNKMRLRIGYSCIMKCKKKKKEENVK